MSRWVVVLAGGTGTRFWPLSTPRRPKQLLPLVDDKPLLRNQLDRLAPLVPRERTIILTSEALAGEVARVASDIPRANIVAEPRAGGTAAALAWAAWIIQQRDAADATMISVHADWAIGNPARFRATLDLAAAAAEAHQALVTVGVLPSRPDPGFGYIQPGAEVDVGVRRVARFVEKPDRARVKKMWKSGFLWNSGIFAWRVTDFLSEIDAHTPEIAPALRAHGDDAAEYFRAVQPIAVDHGVLERSNRVLVVDGDFGWDDVGTWGALARVRARDPLGNVASGDVHFVDAHRNVVHAERGDVVLYGVNDLVLVVHDGVVLVTTVDRSADLKTLVDALPPPVRERK